MPHNAYSITDIAEGNAPKGKGEVCGVYAVLVDVVGLLFVYYSRL